MQSLKYNYNGNCKCSNEEIVWKWISHYSVDLDFLEKNLDKVSWEWLSENPNAIPIIEQNLDKVNWCALSINTNFGVFLIEFIKNEMILFL
jgi:hypothetical protein